MSCQNCGLSAEIAELRRLYESVESEYQRYGVPGPSATELSQKSFCALPAMLAELDTLRGRVALAEAQNEERGKILSSVRGLLPEIMAEQVKYLHQRDAVENDGTEDYGYLRWVHDKLEAILGGTP